MEQGRESSADQGPLADRAVGRRSAQQSRSSRSSRRSSLSSKRPSPPIKSNWSVSTNSSCSSSGPCSLRGANVTCRRPINGCCLRRRLRNRRPLKTQSPTRAMKSLRPHRQRDRGDVARSSSFPKGCRTRRDRVSAASRAASLFVLPAAARGDQRASDAAVGVGAGAGLHHRARAVHVCLPEVPLGRTNADFGQAAAADRKKSLRPQRAGHDRRGQVCPASAAVSRAGTLARPAADSGSRGRCCAAWCAARPRRCGRWPIGCWS